MSEKNVVGMDGHKAKARASTAHARMALWTTNGEASLVVEHTADAATVLVSLGDGGDMHLGEFERVALTAFLERALAVAGAPPAEAEDEYD